MGLKVSFYCPSTQANFNTDCPFAFLPPETILHLLSFLSVEDMKILSVVAKPLAQLANDKQFWCQFWQRNFGDLKALKDDEKDLARELCYREDFLRRKKVQHTEAAQKLFRANPTTSHTLVATLFEQHSCTTILTITRKEANTDINLTEYEKRLPYLEEFSLNGDPGTFMGVTSQNLQLFFESHPRLSKVTLNGLSKVNEEGLIGAMQKRHEMTDVELVHQNLGNSFLAALSRLAHLRSLKLTGRQTFTPEGMVHFSGISSDLQVLHWHVYNLEWKSAQWKTFFEKHPKLTEVTLEFESPEAIQDDMIAFLCALPHLKSVRLNNCASLTPAGVSQFKTSRLTHIELHGCSRAVKTYLRGKECKEFREKLQGHLLTF